MKLRLSLNSAIAFWCLFSWQPSFPQDRAVSTVDLTNQARHEYSAGKFAEAERDFRDIAQRDPSDIISQIFLGQSLFQQQKYAESVAPYEKAHDLEMHGHTLPLTQHRILIDQLAMAYGISGDLKKSQALLDTAIRNDPEYPLNYYNLACVFAKSGDKSKVIANLSLALQRNDNVLKGETLPDPRTDESFQEYAADADFVSLMKKFGYE